jgi:hypothetical protein
MIVAVGYWYLVTCYMRPVSSIEDLKLMPITNLKEL